MWAVPVRVGAGSGLVTRVGSGWDDPSRVGHVADRVPGAGGPAAAQTAPSGRRGSRRAGRCRTRRMSPSHIKATIGRLGTRRMSPSHIKASIGRLGSRCAARHEGRGRGRGDVRVLTGVHVCEWAVCGRAAGVSEVRRIPMPAQWG